MTSPFKKKAKELYQAGYSIIPLHAGDKRPFEKEWSRFCTKRMAKKDVKSYMAQHNNFNIGVALGPASSIVALDFDDDLNGFHDKIKEIIPESPVTKIGGKGFTAFYRYNGEKNRSWKFKRDGVKYTVLELLAEGRQTVLPPSVHPNGGTYYYDSIEGLEDVSPDELPTLPEGFNRMVDKILGVAEDSTKPDVEASLDDIRDALKHISADDYEDWVRCGMAIKKAYPEEGFEVWDGWSSQSPKYNQKEMRPKWDSFQGGGISLGTLVYLAMQEGWEPSFSSDEMKADVMRYFISLDQVEDEIDSLREGGRCNGTPCGLPCMDGHLNFRRGEVTVYSGYANAGKSEFLDSVIHGLMTSRDDRRVAIASMEKGQRKHYDDLIHKVTGKPRNDRTVVEYREAKKFIRNHVIMLDYSAVQRDLKAMLMQVKRYMNFGQVDDLVIDPFNLIKKERGLPLMDHASEVVSTLSNFARENDIHIHVIAHPTKPPESFKKQYQTKTGVKESELPKLTMYSISGGADWQNISDNIVLVNRLEGTQIEVDIAKIRDQEVDRTGKFVLDFDRYSRSYTEVVVFGDEGEY